MRVSVVIPTYNSAPLVVEAVRSVLAQTRPAHEVVVVDDGSTDDTAELVAGFGPPVRYIRQENARVAAARNTGIRAMTGDAVAFLDADDVWHPRKLELQAAALAAHPHLGLLATRVFPWPGEFPAVGEGQPEVAELRTVDLLPVNPLGTSSILARQSVLDRVGEFDRELFGPEDYDLWLRCSRVAGVGVLREPLTGYRDTPGSLGKQAETMYNGLMRIHAKLASAGVWDGRPWLRRRCKAHVEYTTAYMHYAAGRPGRAVRLLAQSLCTYPGPMSPPVVRFRWARARLLARTLAAWAGTARAGKPSHAGAS